MISVEYCEYDEYDENHPAQKNRGSQGRYQTNTSAVPEPDPLHATPH